MNYKRFFAIASIAFLGAHSAAGEGLVVIVHSEMHEPLSSQDIARIFLGKSSQFPTGEKVEPLNIDPADPNYTIFARKVLRKSPSQLRAYWARQVFTGRGTPPKSRKTDEELLRLVATGKQYLTYVDAEKTSETVRVVLEVETEAEVEVEEELKIEIEVDVKT